MVLSPPFPHKDQLDDSPAQQSVPGYPNLKIQDAQAVLRFLQNDLQAIELDRLVEHISPYNNSAQHIFPLHQHRFKGREIFISEDPDLHLTIIYDRIFLKPIPRYLLSYDFWNDFLISRNQAFKTDTELLQSAARGFLRTYFHLIRYESDLRIAKENGLLSESIKWDKWNAFIIHLQNVSDNEGSPRYRHGQLQISRLNWLSKIYLHRFQFREMHGPQGGYLRRFYEPLLFVFGVSSLMLSAMQVGLGALPNPLSDSWEGFNVTCRWIAVINLMMLAFLVLIIPLQWMLVLLSKGLAWTFGSE